jgi:hypothetical protein
MAGIIIAGWDPQEGGQIIKEKGKKKKRRAGLLSSHGGYDGKAVLCRWRLRELIYLWLC